MKIVLQVAALSIPVCAVAQTAQAPQEHGKYENHVVKKGETLYSLSRRYNTTVPAILDLNASIVNNNLKTGSTVRIPKVETAQAQAASYKGIGPKPFLVPVYYEVAKGQTLYSIGQQTGNDVEVVKLWNDLKTNNIKPGQKLIVGYADQTQTIKGTPRAIETVNTNTQSVPVVQTASATTNKNSNDRKQEKAAASNHTPSKSDASLSSTKPVNASAIAPKETLEVSTKPINASAASGENTELKTGAKHVSVYETNPAAAKLVYMNEKGICTWTRGSSENGAYYALHPTAPIGSTINVKNMMNNRSVQVKVIGRLPNTSENENIAIKISGSAAKELNALDSKFLTQMSYMGYEKAKS